jgi:methionine synthase I (cobalamin-dependent)
MLYAKGFYLNTCFDELNLTQPEVVKEIHRAYVQSGVDIIETNTFGANRFKLQKHGLEDKVREINRAGARIARDEAGKDVLIAGSIGPIGVKIEPWGPTSLKAERLFLSSRLSAT